VTANRYRIAFTSQAAKQVEKLDKVNHGRILLAVAELETNPRPDGVKKLKGHDNRWRIRVGDWRVLYQIEDGQLVVLVVPVGHRSKAYKEK
jgi:mRNA interferase RelE/StbE